MYIVALFPVPRPAFHRLQYGTASDEKLGVGLGTRLCIHSMFDLITGSWIKSVEWVPRQHNPSLHRKSYLLALGFSEQLTAATHTMFQLGTLAADWHATLVEPVVVTSHLFGLRGMLPPMFANTSDRDTIRLSEIYEISLVNEVFQSLISLGLSMVPTDDFLLHAPREVTLLHFIDRNHIGDREFAFNMSETISIERTFQETNLSVIDCSSVVNARILMHRLENHLNAMRTSLKVRRGRRGDFTVKRLLCLDQRLVYRSHILLQNVSLPGTVIFTNWHGCAITNCSMYDHGNLQLFRKPNNSAKFRPIVLTQKGVLFKPIYRLHHPSIYKAASEYLSISRMERPFIAIHIRIERLIRDEVRLNVKSDSYIIHCLESLIDIFDNLRGQYDLQRKLLITDMMGQYGTDSCQKRKYCSKSRVQQFLWILERRLGLTVNTYDPKALNGTENSGYVSLVEMNMLAQGEKLILVGHGGFQANLEYKFLSLNHKTEDVYHLCGNSNVTL